MGTNTKITCDNCGREGTYDSGSWYHLESRGRRGSLVAEPGPFDYCSGPCLAVHVARRFEPVAPEREKPEGDGWAKPPGARKWHYFAEGEVLSECWRLYWAGDRVPRDDDSPDNCRHCRSRLHEQGFGGSAGDQS